MIEDNLKRIKEELIDDICLVAVSKTKPNEDILEAYQAGQRVFGENKALELRDKAAELPKDIEWHFIGRLQTNKVRYVVKAASLIHSVDRIKLLREINKEALKLDIVQDVLIQVNISNEESKTGFDRDQVSDFLEETENFQNINVVGLMTMAPFVENAEEVRYVFKEMKVLFEHFKQKYDLKYLSMGMSNDYHVAIQEGANMVRIGSKIFGSRIYKSSK